MPRTILTTLDVASALGLDVRTVERLAAAGELPGRKAGAEWKFRAAEVSDWAGRHLGALPSVRPKQHPVPGLEPLLPVAFQPATVSVQLSASTRRSVLSELVDLAGRSGRVVDPRGLLAAVVDREKQQPTALSGGIAIPHSSQVGGHVGEVPVIAAGRVEGGLPFGDPGGGLTDLFFLLCCTNYREHLLYLGRLGRLLSDETLLDELRGATAAGQFVEALWRAEERLCGAE